MQYTLKIRTNLKKEEAIEDIEEAINTDIILALSKEEWEYKRESALVERLDFLQGKAGKLNRESNSVTIKRRVYGERKEVLQLPGVVQGGLTGAKLLELVKRDLMIAVPLKEFYDPRQFKGGIPRYISETQISIRAKRVSPYSEGEFKELFKKTEEEVRKDPIIDLIFAQGPKSKSEVQLIDHFYLKRPKIQDVTYDISSQGIHVSSPGTSYINLRPYKRVDRKELSEKRGKAIKLAKDFGVSISYKRGTKRIIDENWLQYTNDLKLSEEYYKELQNRWETIRTKRGLHGGTRDDMYLEKTTSIRWRFEALNHRSEAISKINEIDRELTKTYERLLEQKENPEWGRVNKVYL